MLASHHKLHLQAGSRKPWAQRGLPLVTELN